MKKIEKIFFRKIYYGFFKGGIKIAILEKTAEGETFAAMMLFWF